MNQQTKDLVKEVLMLLRVRKFRTLSRAYGREDQKLMKSRKWDAYNPALITNKVKAILEQIDLVQLNKTDRMWRNEILWFWYHHAISCERDRKRAQGYATKALGLQGKDHPNRITQLLWFLTHDRVDEAKKWMAEAPAHADKVEHQTGLELIDEYERREFWK